MLGLVEKFKTEIFVFLSTLLGYILGRRKINADVANTDADSNKAKAEEVQIRVQTMLELQRGIAELQAKFQEMYDANEARRNANRTEQDRMAAQLSDVTARNVILSDQIKVSDARNFERELVWQAKIAELEKKLLLQETRVEFVEKKTGSLENKMPLHGE